MTHGGRPLLIGATIAGTFLFGTLVDAGTEEQPYIAMFQDLEVTEQSNENAARLVGSGFAPNSSVAVTIVDNTTGDIVYEEDQTSDAVGQTDLALTLDPPLAPGNYSATITGVTPSDAPLQLSGALTIAEVFAAPGTTNAGSASTPDPAATESAAPSSGSDNSMPDDTVSATPADNTLQQTSSSDDSSLAPWVIGGAIALSGIALLTVIIRRRGARTAQ